ncbi:MAG: cation diffusion facilitator family transporter, partial [Myxococcales bacterium]
MAAPASSVTAVTTALGANVLITIAKFVAFFFSGSASMLSEAIHSFADAGNQFLLFMGLRRAGRQSDEEFHYGYGAERFVFGILSAAGIFFIGCGVTIWHGVQGLLHPHEPEIGLLTWVVLAFSLVVEGGSMVVAVLAVRKEAGGIPFFTYVRTRADPAAVAILLEDAAAVVGLLLAALGIVLFALTGNPVWDALGSVLVGITLGWIAVHLAIENRELLLGKSVPPEVHDRFEAILAGTPGIRRVSDVKSRQLTPESWFFKAEVTLDEAVIAERVAAALPAD